MRVKDSQPQILKKGVADYVRQSRLVEHKAVMKQGDTNLQHSDACMARRGLE